MAKLTVDSRRPAFLLFRPCADLVSYLRGAWSQGFEIPLKRWFGVASHRCPAEFSRRDLFLMNALQRAPLRLAPITSGLVRSNPKILLGGSHQPSLLRYLDGWPKRWGRPRAFVVQFTGADESLEHCASNSFDLAVIQAPSAERLEDCVRQLVRVARQGLIVRRMSI